MLFTFCSISIHGWSKFFCHFARASWMQLDVLLTSSCRFWWIFDGKRGEKKEIGSWKRFLYKGVIKCCYEKEITRRWAKNEQEWREADKEYIWPQDKIRQAYASQNSDWARTWKSNFKWHQVPSSSYFAVRHQTLCRSPSNECNICYKIRIKCHQMSAIQSRIGHNIPLDNQTHRCWPGFRREQLMFYDLRIPSAGVETFVKSLMSFGSGMQLFTLSAIHCSSY